jgi:hypothetical protein
VTQARRQGSALYDLPAADIRANLMDKLVDAMNQQNILFVVQVLSLAFLIIYVIKTWHMASATRKAAEATERSVSELREARDQETAPFVIAYFDIPAGTRLLYLTVKNIGRSIATRVRLEFSPPLCASGSVRLDNLSLIKDGIESMPPGYELKCVGSAGIGQLLSSAKRVDR